MQLVNPTVAGKIRVYHDPFAKEAASLGIGGIDVVGGEDKSYYVKKGTEVAFLLKKKNYDDEFKPLFQSCTALVEKYGDNPKWMEFEKHIFEYGKNCE